MRRSRHEMRKKIFIGNVRPYKTLAAALLALEGIRRNALYIPALRIGDHYFFIGNQILHVERFKSPGNHLRAAGIAVSILQFFQFSFDDAQNPLRTLEDCPELLDKRKFFLELFFYFLTLERSERLQAHFE